MNKVENIISEIAKKNNLKLDINNKEATLKSLGIDSLAAMELIINIEEKVGKTLDDDVLINIKTLGELIEAFSK